jgi:hypothetical protein
MGAVFGQYDVVVTLGLAAVAVASWSLRPASRRLGSQVVRHSVSSLLTCRVSPPKMPTPIGT